MFNRRYKEKNYLDAASKINIPELRGENCFVNNRKKYTSRRKKYGIVSVAAAALLITLSVGNSKVINKDIDKNTNGFTIVAYANETEIQLKDNTKFELPSGYINDDSFVMQGFYISSPDLKSFKVTSSVGSVSCSALSANESYCFNEVMYIGDKSAFCNLSQSDVQGVVVKYRSDEEINSMIKNMPSVTIQDQPCDNNFKGNNNDSQNSEYSPTGIISDMKDNKNVINDSGYNVISGDEKSIEIEQIDNSNRYYINWMPEMEFLKSLCTNSVNDYTSEKGCVLTMDMTFQDGTSTKKIINLNFDSEGKLMVECN